MGSVGIALVLFVLLVSGGLPLSVTVNEASLPWLLPGTYADYTSGTPVGSPPEYVLPNGTILVGYGAGCSSRCNAIADLSWVVTNRGTNYINMALNYSITGEELPKLDSLTLIPFNFSVSLRLKVNIETGMAYIDGQPQGVIGLWAEPLPSESEAIVFGTIAMNGAMHNVTGIMNGHSKSDIEPVMVNGSPFTGELDTYNLDDSNFGQPLTAVWAGENSTLVGFGGQPPPPYRNLPPSAFYDYYNGLAMGYTLPEYPVEATVCNLHSNVTTGCQVTTFSTALGQYLRTVSGSVYLSSTNISLLPGVSGSQPLSLYLQFSVGAVIAIAVVGTVIFFSTKRRRSRRNSLRLRNRAS